MRKSKTYNAILLIFLAVIFFTGLFFSSRDLLIVFNGTKTEGIVVDSYCPNSCNRRIVNINYADNVGNSHQITEIGTLFPLYNKGDKTVVYYDKNKPGNSVDFSSFTFIIPALFLVLLTLPIFGLISLFKKVTVNP